MMTLLVRDLMFTGDLSWMMRDPGTLEVNMDTLVVMVTLGLDNLIVVSGPLEEKMNILIP